MGKKISELPESTDVYDGCCMPIVTNGETKKIYYSLLKSKLKDDLLSEVYPIGSIYMSINNTNPAVIFGGTWVRWGDGRVPVGVNTNDSNFNTVEKTGGSKYMQYHNHSFTGTSSTTGSDNARHNHGISMTDINNNINAAINSLSSYIQEDVKYTLTGNGGRPGTSNTHTSMRSDIIGSAMLGTETVTRTENAPHTHTFKASGTVGYAGDGSDENLQPYITCYMWKRTA